MVTVVRRLLKTLFFIAIFCLISWLDVPYLSQHPLISNDTAIKAAHWFVPAPYPEDIYAIFDYTLILFNLIITISGYLALIFIFRKIAS